MKLKRILINILLLPVFNGLSGSCDSAPKEPQYLEIPGTEGANGGNNQAVDFFLNQLGGTAPQLNVGPAQQIPLQGIAGMGGNEQTVQALLAKYLGTSATDSEAYKLGMGELSKTLGGEYYDPKTSDFWKGYRDTSQMEQEAGVSDIRRRGQLGGGLYAEPNQRTEANYVEGMGAQRTMQLGGLYENERNRKTNAVGQALGYAGFEEQGTANRIGLGATVGAVPREIQNQQYAAQYNQQLGQSTADFNQQQQSNQALYNQQLGTSIMQTGAAQQIMPQWYVDNTQQANPMTGIMGMVSSIASCASL